MDAVEYLDSVRNAHPELSDWCNTLSDFYQRKLWYDLTFKLDQFTVLPVLQTGDNLIQLYHNFIIHFELRIMPLMLAHFAVRISSQYPEDEAGINFLKRVIEKLQSTREKYLEGPILFINMQIAFFYLRKQDHKECKNLLDNGDTTLNSMSGIDPCVYAHYYWMSCQYHMFLQDPAEFHKNAILFLKYASLESLPDLQKRFITFHTFTTAMLGDNIYNFGELLEHPIIKRTRDHKTCLSSQPALVENEKKILEKISILQFMEFIYSIPSKDRTIPLTTIAEHMKLTVKDVEHLLMKSLSAHLIEGVIDEVDGTVHVTRVQPRVQEINQIEYLRHRLSNWLGKVQWVILSAETGTPEFVAL
ncbi:hypothetical protein L1987_68029 [Smallanthus sonchifolius]|uniref:Uncharacterized protein n=1 Tax=Smallanthus sonchifolius TaxID=185202 RepID=A0ACB9B3P7_9ASTR|nr:hypothetical protein L1987_68029 [Smallanthus sonchifolius]